MNDIHPTAWIAPDCIIGEGCRVGAGVRIGTLGTVTGIRRSKKGRVILGDGIDIGANTVIHRGVDQGDTIIDKNTFIGALCNIGHNVEIGEHCVIAPMSCISGYVKIGNKARIAPYVAIKNRIKIGDNARVGIGSLVMHDVPAGVTVVGRPAMKIEDFRKLRIRLKELIQ